MSEINTGEGNGFYGKTHTEETKQLISGMKKEVYVGEGNPFFGREHSNDSKAKISAAKLGKPTKKSKIVIITDTLTKENWSFLSVTEMSRSEKFPGYGPIKALKANRLYLKKYSINYAEN